MSDTHDNIWKLEDAMPYLVDCDTILHCGDLIAPFIVVQLGEGVPDKPIHIVWGNNDGDKRLLTEKALESSNIYIHGDFADLELSGAKIAINHYPAIARALAASGEYDLVCYGHDHTAHQEMIGETVLLNPGEVMGLKGRSTIAIFDTDQREIEWIELS
jgi:putative phosphoesterase